MNQLLDENVAARIKAECRDPNELHRFQRSVFVVETILEAMGFPKTVKVVRELRLAVGLIPGSMHEPPAEQAPERPAESPAEQPPAEQPSVESQSRFERVFPQLQSAQESIAPPVPPVATSGNGRGRRRKVVG